MMMNYYHKQIHELMKPKVQIIFVSGKSLEFIIFIIAISHPLILNLTG